MTAKQKRAFSAPPLDLRCKAVVKWNEGGLTDCMRKAKVGLFCVQHARIYAVNAARAGLRG